MAKMTDSEARAIARAFIARIKNGAWTMRDVDAVMPRDWELDEDVGIDSMYPVTIANIAHVIRHNSVRI